MYIYIYVYMCLYVYVRIKNPGVDRFLSFPIFFFRWPISHGTPMTSGLARDV